MRQIRGHARFERSLQFRVERGRDATRSWLCFVQTLGQQCGGQRRLQRTRSNRFDLGIVDLRKRPRAERGHAIEHLVACAACRARVAIRAQAAGRLRQDGEQCRLGMRKARSRFPQIRPRCGFDALDRATERRAVEIQGQYLFFRQVHFELKCAQDLAQLAAETVRRAVEDARDLHGQGRAARHQPAMHDPLTERARHREWIDAGMRVEPAVLIGEQRFDVERRYILRPDRITPHAIAVRERAQRRAVAREHDRAAAGRVRQRKREQAIERKREGEQQQDDDDAAFGGVLQAKLHLSTLRARPSEQLGTPSHSTAGILPLKPGLHVRVQPFAGARRCRAKSRLTP